MLTDVVAVTTLSSLLGAALGYAAIRFRVEGNPLAEQVVQALPQTQCGQCGFAGCKDYAEALARGDAEVDLCPPGGQAVVIALADLLGRDPPQKGAVEKPKTIAVIDEQTCIGCTLCQQACPVDAILGAAKHMHTVIRDECTGCELCMAPCPVECIAMVPIKQDISTWKWPYPYFSLTPVAKVA